MMTTPERDERTDGHSRPLMLALTGALSSPHFRPKPPLKNFETRNTRKTEAPSGASFLIAENGLEGVEIVARREQPEVFPGLAMAKIAIHHFFQGGL